MLNRRVFLKQMSMLLGGALSAPALLALENSHQLTGLVNDKTLFNDDIPLFTRIANTIIPATDTPGAADAKVGNFVHDMVNQVFNQQQQLDFANHLQLFRQRTKIQMGQDFMNLSAAQQQQWLTELNQDMVHRRWGQPVEQDNGLDFFQTMKEFTIIGFFTSEIGATKVLKYDPIPGSYKGSVPYKEIGRAWAE
ncbi:gluconate 2-dehydrogenase subunit 3 family protein [Neptunicella sp. SCSIO 80796]|uniref:gluconate 2-dehydrogenase subunit 3 family protein n=1 Tax=Neptunicella plasticusilytica TaxID=3117012 RepID=UPI003A4DF424